MMTSFSRPSNPSTVFTSISATSAARSVPSHAWNAAPRDASTVRYSEMVRIWAAYGAMTPMSEPRRVWGQLKDEEETERLKGREEQ